MTTSDWYDDNAESYYSRTYSFDFFPGLREDLAEFASQLPTVALVADLGSGSGRDTEFLASRGFHVVSLDLSLSMLAKAVQRCHGAGAAGVCGDVRSLPFADEVFSGIWACGVFLHLPLPEIGLGLREALRVLKPGGVLAVSMKQGHGQEIREDGRPFTLLGSDELAHLLSATGFGDIRVRGPARRDWLIAFARR